MFDLDQNNKANKIQESDDELNTSDIDLNASYSDDDFENIPLEEKKFWEYEQKLSENSLFEMNLLQEMQ